MSLETVRVEALYITASTLTVKIVTFTAVLEIIHLTQATSAMVDIK